MVDLLWAGCTALLMCSDVACPDMYPITWFVTYFSIYHKNFTMASSIPSGRVCGKNNTYFKGKFT